MPFINFIERKKKTSLGKNHFKSLQFPNDKWQRGETQDLNNNESNQQQQK